MKFHFTYKSKWQSRDILEKLTNLKIWDRIIINIIKEIGLDLQYFLKDILTFLN